MTFRINGFGNKSVRFKGAIKINKLPPGLSPTAQVLASSTSIGELSSITFTVNTTNFPSGTLYCDIESVSGAVDNISDLVVIDSFAISSSTGTVDLFTIPDFTTEGTESFRLRVRTDSTQGNIIGISSIITINDTSTDLVATVTPNTTSVNEGSAVTFNVTLDQSVTTTLYWDLNTVSGTINESDFVEGVTSGSFPYSGGTGSVVLTLKNDVTTEPTTESFQLRVKRMKSGNLIVIGTSATVTVNDTSVTVPPTVQTFSYGFSSDTSNGNQVASPCNNYYRKNIFQTVYTVAELSANGAAAGAVFNKLRWYITDAVPSTNSVRGLNIKIFHTTNTNSSTDASPIGSKTTVYSVSDTTAVTEFESLGPCTFNFANTFTWDGTNNICIESCTAMNETNWTTNGTQRIVNAANGSIYQRDDEPGTLCGTTPATTTGATFKPSVEMDYTINYAVVSGTKAPVLGSGPVTSYPAAGWTSLQNAHADDQNAQVNLPFSFTIDNTAFTTVFPNSNCYLTFGSGSTEYLNLGSSVPAIPKLMYGAGDLSYQRVSTIISGSDYVRIRQEGFNNSSLDGQGTPVSVGTSNIIFEITIFNPSNFNGQNVIELLVGNWTSDSKGYQNVSNISNTNSAYATYTMSASQSYVFVGNSTGTSWTVNTGSKVLGTNY